MDSNYEAWYQMCSRFTYGADEFDRRAALCGPRESPRQAICLSFPKRKRAHESPLMSAKLQKMSSSSFVSQLPSIRNGGIPQDCWSRVFSFLSASFHSHLSHTCRLFRKLNLLPGSWPSELQGLQLCDSDLRFFQAFPLTHLSLGSKPRVGANALIDFLSDPKRDSLKALSIHNLALSPWLRSWQLPAIGHLELSTCGLQADDVIALCCSTSLQHLTTLDLSNNPFPDDALTQLNKLGELSCLNLSGCNALTDTCLEHLVDNKLRKLALAGVKLLGDVGMLNLCKIGSLEALNLSNLPNLTDGGILAIGDLPLLQVLDLSFTKVTALALLSRLSSVRFLCLLRCPCLPISTVLKHMPVGTRIVMEAHVFGERNPWLKQDDV